MLTGRTRLARPALAAGLALCVAAGLAGCGSDDGKDARDGKESTSPSPTESTSAPAAYLDVPDGVTLTEPGTALALGEEGVVAFQRRQDQIGVLAVTVERIERTTFQDSFVGWNVDDATAARTPYFVRVKVTNVGDTDLGGARLDNVVYANDGSTLEAPNYYTAQQQPLCVGGALPAVFANGASAELCQVYFVAPAQTLVSIDFPPYGGLDDITWTGELSPVTPLKPVKPGRKGGRKGAGKGAGATPSATATATASATATP
ncbi:MULTISPECIES: hypothetical protein [unclassified Nocardioides]|uniref:hypothetical protein n=1 Tax=unclassified Nocardioides TaxID=2615069 RepID=UPI00070354E3|nr:MULTISPECIES: hypothetical protein [unclassified Nocardioides]KRC57739.1 hypothetical protein ASE19_23575 [Nocardioides sp. Root79]KRC74942.1 hypothetical protein ASE20_23535 [Nocardioides sp. Root240]